MEILPIVRAASWSGWTSGAGRDLPGGELRAGVVGAGGILHPDELAAEALENLRKRPAEWLVTERRGGIVTLGGKPLRVEHVDEMATERLLDSHFLLRAHALIDQAVLAVAAPVRGVLLATAAIAPPRELAAFLTLAKRIHQRGTMEPLTPSVFTVQDGRLTGVLRPRRHPSREIPSAP
jgi:hypothetical protein